MPRHWARLLGALLAALVLFRLGYFAYQKAPPYGKVHAPRCTCIVPPSLRLSDALPRAQVRLWLWTRTHEQLFRPPTGTIEALRAAVRAPSDFMTRARSPRRTRPAERARRRAHPLLLRRASTSTHRTANASTARRAPPSKISSPIHHGRPRAPSSPLESSAT